MASSEEAHSSSTADVLSSSKTKIKSFIFMDIEVVNEFQLPTHHVTTWRSEAEHFKRDIESEFDELTEFYSIS